MNHMRIARERRGKSVATNVSLDANLVAEARELGINISQASMRGLEDAVRSARAQQWLDENRASLEWWNEYVENHGLPLAQYRQF